MFLHSLIILFELLEGGVDHKEANTSQTNVTNLIISELGHFHNILFSRPLKL